LSEEDCFHLGVKGLCLNSEGKVLLVECQRKKSGEKYWDLPGGRIQKGETVLGALQRELEEEVGLQNVQHEASLGMSLTKIRIPKQEGDVGLILALYSCKVPNGFIPVLGDGHTDYGWFSLEDAVGLLGPQYPSDLVQSISVIN
jgi:8-oxo-dGTP pyrophosphatase MutT (NUDIX family)